MISLDVRVDGQLAQSARRRPRSARVRPTECSYEVLASGLRRCLRDYGGPDSGLLLLIIAAPIKRPYLWDLTPSVSAVNYCLRQGLHVYLLEWTPPSPSNSNAGLVEYADQAIGEAVATVLRKAGEMQPFLVGHSLGGTLAAVFAVLRPQSIKGLVLLSAPDRGGHGAAVALTLRDRTVVRWYLYGVPEQTGSPIEGKECGS